MRCKVLRCSNCLAIGSFMSQPVNLKSTSAWTVHCASWFQGYTHILGGLQIKYCVHLGCSRGKRRASRRRASSVEAYNVEALDAYAGGHTENLHRASRVRRVCVEGTSRIRRGYVEDTSRVTSRTSRPGLRGTRVASCSMRCQWILCVKALTTMKIFGRLHRTL